MSVVERCRRLLCQTMQSLPGSSEQFGPPRHVVAEASTWLSQHGDSGALHSIFDQVLVQRKMPAYADEPLNSMFASMQSGAIPPRFVVALRGGRYWGRSYGYVISPDDTLLADISPTFQNYGKPLTDVRSHDGLTVPQLPSVRKLPGRVLALNTLFCTNFHHLLLDTLPKLDLLQRAGMKINDFDHVVLDYTGAPFQQELLVRAGVALNKIIASDARVHLRADELVVPSYSEPGARVDVYQYSDEGIQFIRSAFTSEIAGARRGKRLLVSRKLAKVRRWIQEEDALMALRSLGLERVQLENHSVAEQARMFAESELVLMPHGGGLANCVFAQPGTKIIELFNPVYLPTFMMPLAHACDLEYHALVGDRLFPQTHEPSTIYGAPANTDDISISAERVLTYVRSLL